jgi:hypothetical protein
VVVNFFSYLIRFIFCPAGGFTALLLRGKRDAGKWFSARVSQPARNGFDAPEATSNLQDRVPEEHMEYAVGDCFGQREKQKTCKGC